MPRPPSDRVKVSFYVPAKTLQALKRIAELKGTTYSDLIRQAAMSVVVTEGRRVLEDQRVVDDLQPPPK
jgi:hypothetical protein